MTGRLIIAIVSTCLEETAIAFGILWGVPKLGVELPLWALISIAAPVMLAWLSYSVFTFHKGTIALKRGHIIGMPNMIGTEGVTVTRLDPEGMVRIRSELWVAKSAGDALEPGEKIIVTEQERLKLVVRGIESEK